jgi:DNA polymerase III gamma/tau subunit
MLLKPIEEPAQGVLWILVARDAARLSASIVSRCITVEFRTPSDEVVVERLRQRAEAGGITVEEGGIEMLAQAAHGSVLLAVDDLAELADAFGKNVRLRHIRCLVDGIRTPFWIRTRNFVAASLVRKFPWAHRESQFELERGVPPLELVNRVLYLVHLIEIADRGGEDDLRAAMKAGRHYAQEARDVLDLVDGARSLLPQAHEDLMSDWRDECMKCLSLCGQMKNDYVMDYLWARLARRIDSIETRKKDGTREEAGAGGSDIGDL